jgi:predicted nucleic acid-binding protein
VQPVILDTDVASLTHKRKLTAPLATRLIGRKPLITFVTFGELTKWTEIRHWGTRSRQELADWLSGIPILPGDEPVAAMWGRLSAAGIQRGRPRPINDMWIALFAREAVLALAGPVRGVVAARTAARGGGAVRPPMARVRTA